MSQATESFWTSLWTWS